MRYQQKTPMCHLMDIFRQTHRCFGLTHIIKGSVKKFVSMVENNSFLVRIGI